MNIIVSFYVPSQHEESKLICFYDSFVSSLIENGNNVLVHNVVLWENTGLPAERFEQFIEESIENFKPDLIFAFNNQKYHKISKITDCPILIWNSDLMDYFSQKEEIAENPGRFYFLSFLENGIKNYRGFGIPADRIFVIGAGTSIQNTNAPKTMDFSFVATKFHTAYALNKLIEDPAYNLRISKLFQNFLKNPIYDKEEFLAACGELSLSDKLSTIDFWHIANIREMTLMYLLDQDIHIFGQYWELYAQSFPAIYAAYRHKSIYTLAENSTLYNASKICLNMNHPQAGDTGYSFRVLDILASGGCLVSNYSTGIESLTRGYVDIPMFKTPVEARKICLDLLRDESRRAEIVEGANRCIEKNGRWSHRFADIEQILGMKLLNANAARGKLSFSDIGIEVTRFRHEEEAAVKRTAADAMEKVNSIPRPTLKQRIKRAIQGVFHLFGIEIRRYRG